MPLKLLSWNLWHGLTGEGYLKIGELESPMRRQLRSNHQVSLLQQESFDIVCLQEVNPLSEKQKKFSNLVKMSSHATLDNSGCRFLGFGWPENLTSGLLTLFKPQRFKSLGYESLKLSGEWFSWTGFCSSFQLSESRYALLSFLYDKKLKEKILVVNTHFHHKPEWGSFIEGKLKTLVSQGELNQDLSQSIKREMLLADQRRHREWITLSQVLESYEDNFDKLFLCGDFNVTRRSQLYQRIIESGYDDLTLDEQGGSLVKSTWVCDKNENIKVYSPYFHSFSKALLQKLSDASKETLYNYEVRSRQIDYVFCKSKTKPSLNHHSCELFSSKTLGLQTSDHFGLSVVVEPTF